MIGNLGFSIQKNSLIDHKLSKGNDGGSIPLSI